MASNAGKFKDRNPNISAAGKVIATGDTASKCLATPPEGSVHPMVKKFYATTQPEPGKPRIFHGKAGDSSIADDIVHGVDTKPSFLAGDIVNPRPKTLFSQRLADKREAIYSSRKQAPLGKSHDQSLPEGVGLYDVSYGVPTVREGYAGDIINPPKPRDLVEIESSAGKDLYKVSHHVYDVGETYDRQYNWQRIPKTSTFGVETPHDNDGIQVKKTLKWLYNTQTDKASHIVSKRVDDFRERTQPQLGKVHDPIKDTMRVPPDHIFGVLFKPDECGAGDLIHGRIPTQYLRHKEHQRSIVAAIRQHLKKSNYHHFQDLKSAFHHYDKDNSGKISIDELRGICEQLKLPVEDSLLDALISYCDTDGDKQIDYEEFSNFLNWPEIWNDQLHHLNNISEQTGEGVKDGDKNTRFLPSILKSERQIDKAVGGWQTSSAMINGGLKGIETKEWRKYGVPTIRSDLAAPRIKRVSDRTNYGDESDAYGLINPSIYSNNGVHEKDFFQSRSPNELHRVVDAVGMKMTSDTFDMLWKKAASQHPKGLVSVNSFKNVLDNVHPDELKEVEMQAV